MKSLYIAALTMLIRKSLAWDNSPPIPPYQPMTW